MQQKSKTNAKTLSEKVSDLLLNPNGSDGSEESADEATAPKVVDFDEDYELPDGRTTDIRKRNVKLLSEQSARYKGKIATRKELEEDSEEQDEDEPSEEEEDLDDEDDSEDNSDEGALNAFSMKLKSSTNYDYGDDSDSDEDKGSENGVDEDDEDEDDDDQDDYDDGEEEDDDDEESNEDDDEEVERNDMIAATNRQAEIEKGRCVQNQLRIWERLLELRIHSQKMLGKCNQLPEPSQFQQQQQENENVRTACSEATQNVTQLLKTLMGLQTALTGQFSEVQTAMKGSLKRPSPFDETKGGAAAPPLKRVADHLQERFGEFRSYRNGVLLKWDDRTKLLTPGAGAKKRTINEEFDIIRKIDNALMNRTTLIEKSQIPKNNQQQKEDDAGDTDKTLLAVNGHALEQQQRCVNVYDDSDFYHQQLRELIEYKANTSTNMTEVTKQFVELQKLRQKMKKKVDTRASKGRKIRYTVHNKLVNFMAPHDASSWTADSKNELYKSLFAT